MTPYILAPKVVQDLHDLGKLVTQVRNLLFERLHPYGFTIGVNDGQAAG